MDNNLASAIVVSWNGLRFLDDCLSSLLSQSYKSLEVILVINASTDGSKEYVEKKFPKVKIIESKENVGFGPGVNIGIRASKGKYIAFFNDDVLVDKDCIKHMVEIIKSKKADACSAKILFFDKRDTINYAGSMINYMGFIWPKLINQKDRELATQECDYGGICMVRRDVFDIAGMFDENIPMYHCDVDLCFRIKIYGFKLMFNPSAFLYHKYEFKRNKDKFYDLERHRFGLLYKYYSTKSLILIFPMSILIELATIFFSIKSGWFKKKMKSYKEILGEMKALRKERKRIQKARKIKDREFMKNFIGYIKFEMIKSKAIDWFLSPILNIYWHIIKIFI